MPFEIVRNDIVNMQVDAVVNTVSSRPGIGYGVDAGIHKAAGPELLAAREKIGIIPVGQAAMTPGFRLLAKYVIHTVGPTWRGEPRDEMLLYSCYENALRLAAAYRCESIAFPILSSGNRGFPKALSLQTAVNAFSHFLMEHEMQIYLVVFSRSSMELSERLVRSVKSYIDEHYSLAKTLEEYGLADGVPEDLDRARRSVRRRMDSRRRILPREETPLAAQFSTEPDPSGSLEQLLERADAGFSETLLRMIDHRGKTDAEVYKKANIDRKLFSKIRNNPAYRPSKPTALAFAIALELDLEETKDLIGRAGYALTHSSKFDIILEFFIVHHNYNIFEINETLFAFGQSLLGA